MVVEVAKQVAYDKRLSEASVMRANTRNLEYTYRIRVHSPDRPALQPASNWPDSRGRGRFGDPRRSEDRTKQSKSSNDRKRSRSRSKDRKPSKSTDGKRSRSKDRINNRSSRSVSKDRSNRSRSKSKDRSRRSRSRDRKQSKSSSDRKRSGSRERNSSPSKAADAKGQSK